MKQERFFPLLKSHVVDDMLRKKVVTLIDAGDEDGENCTKQKNIPFSHNAGCNTGG